MGGIQASDFVTGCLDLSHADKWNSEKKDVHVCVNKHTSLWHADHSAGDLSLAVTGEGGHLKDVGCIGAEHVYPH